MPMSQLSLVCPGPALSTRCEWPVSPSQPHTPNLLPSSVVLPLWSFCWLFLPYQASKRSINSGLSPESSCFLLPLLFLPKRVHLAYWLWYHLSITLMLLSPVLTLILSSRLGHLAGDTVKAGGHEVITWHLELFRPDASEPQDKDLEVGAVFLAFVTDFLWALFLPLTFHTTLNR